MTVRSDVLLARLLALHPKKIDLALDRILRLLDAYGVALAAAGMMFYPHTEIWRAAASL